MLCGSTTCTLTCVRACVPVCACVYICVSRGGGGSVLCKLRELGPGAHPCILTSKMLTLRCCVLSLLMVLCCTQEDNFDEALRAAFHAWTPPSIREYSGRRQCVVAVCVSAVWFV